jgi:cytoskeletal protein CcmA (bactofilin family)
MTWLGQKPDPDVPRPPSPAPAPSPLAAPAPVQEVSKERMETSNVANIGKSLHIKGELSGSEDLTIDGKVEGKITLHGQHVTIGPNGHVTAEIQAKSVVVGGQMKGNIIADDRVEVVATGAMLGDVRAPRVILADGARFKGSIDMDGKSAPATAKPANAPSPAASDAPAYAGATKS